jgi:hypothetical protein
MQGGRLPVSKGAGNARGSVLKTEGEKAEQFADILKLTQK